MLFSKFLLQFPRASSLGWRLALSLSLTAVAALGIGMTLPAQAQYSYANDAYDSPEQLEYERLSHHAADLFNRGQLTQAIETYEKLLAFSGAGNLGVVYNNLSTVYIRRGNYFQTQKQFEQAQNDFRKAVFYLDSAWPEGLDRSSLNESNRKIALDNLKNGYGFLQVTPSKQKHLDMAKQLRMQGKFPEAIVEYEHAFRLDSRDPVAAKALGDLFTVVNLPEKSKKYYAASISSGVATAGLSEDETLVQLGNAQYKTGEVDKAIANFDKALAINPNNISALNMLEKIWQTEIKFNPSSVLGHANLGSIYQKKKMYEQAMQQYNVAETFADREPNVGFDTKKLIRLNVGTLFQEQKRYEFAMSAYNTVLQVDPKHVMANFYKATLLEETGNTDAALQFYNKVLSLDPNHRQAQVKMLDMIKRQSDPARVAAGLAQYAERFPQSDTIQAQIGEEFHQRKDLTNAAIFYQRALQLNPRLASAWANLGAVYQAQNRSSDALEAFRKAQILEPSNKSFQELTDNALNAMGYETFQQAIALQQEGKHQESLPLFRKTLGVTDNAEIRAAYAVALQSAGQLDDAVAEYRKALGQDAQNADYAYYLGTAYHQKNDLSQARQAYQKALSLNSGHEEARQALASLDEAAASQELEKAIEAFNKKNYASALTLVNQALAKRREEPLAHYYKGLILDGQNKPREAVHSYREAVRYNAEFSDAYYALGVALDTLKDAPGAKMAFQRFLELSSDSDDDFVQYARERLKDL